MKFVKLKKIMVREHEKAHRDGDEARIKELEGWAGDLCFACLDHHVKPPKRAIEFPRDLLTILIRGNVQLKSYSFCQEHLDKFRTEIQKVAIKKQPV